MMDVRGAAGFAFAALLLLGPGWDSREWLAMAFGIYAVLDAAGTLAFVRAARGFETAAYFGRATLGLLAGALLLIQPAASMVALFAVVCAWGLGTGVLEIAFGSRAWTKVPRPVGFMVQGMVSLGLGLTAMHFTHESPAMLRAFLVVYALGSGIAATALGESLHALPSPTRQGA
jgi:uncharacterized membrane protein HdeD (DUF308 family)